MTPGSGVRHSTVELLLSGSPAAPVEDTIWLGGTMPLRVGALLPVAAARESVTAPGAAPFLDELEAP